MALVSNMRGASIVIHLVLFTAGCQANRSFQSNLAGAWAFTDSKEIYSKTGDNAYIPEQDYSKYKMIDDGELRGEEVAIIVRQDGSFDLTRTIYAMLGSNIAELRYANDEITIRDPDNRATGRVRVDHSEYTANRSLMTLSFDVEHVKRKSVLLQAELRPGEVVDFRYVERYDSDANHGIIEHGVRAKLRRCKMPY